MLHITPSRGTFHFFANNVQKCLFELVIYMPIKFQNKQLTVLIIYLLFMIINILRMISSVLCIICQLELFYKTSCFSCGLQWHIEKCCEIS